MDELFYPPAWVLFKGSIITVFYSVFAVSFGNWFYSSLFFVAAVQHVLTTPLILPVNCSLDHTTDPVCQLFSWPHDRSCWSTVLLTTRQILPVNCSLGHTTDRAGQLSSWPHDRSCWSIVLLTTWQILPVNCSLSHMTDPAGQLFSFSQRSDAVRLLQGCCALDQLNFTRLANICVLNVFSFRTPKPVSSHGIIKTVTAGPVMIRKWSCDAGRGLCALAPIWWILCLLSGHREHAPIKRVTACQVPVLQGPWRVEVVAPCALGNLSLGNT